MRNFVLKLYLLIIRLSENHYVLHAGSFRRYTLMRPTLNVQFQQGSRPRRTRCQKTANNVPIWLYYTPHTILLTC